MKAKKVVNIYLLLVISSVTLFLSAAYIYDPMQIFHKAWGREATFHRTMRQQAAGIINNYKFDSFILGSSMMTNTSSQEASNVLGGTFVNLSCDGCNFYERSFILKHALKSKEIKKVIYSLDTQYLVQSKEKKNYPSDNFIFLYDDNKLNDITAYFNKKYIECLIFWKVNNNCTGNEYGYDRPAAWYKQKIIQKRFGGLDNWLKQKNNRQVKRSFKKIGGIVHQIKNNKLTSLKNIHLKNEKAKNYIDTYLIHLIKENSDVEFILIFPPYSRIKYSMWAQYDIESWKTYAYIIRYLANLSSTMTNVKLYSWDNYGFIDNIANYKDFDHYHYSINSWMLSAIKGDEGLLTTANVDEYIQIINEKALNYDLIGIAEKIDDYLQNKTISGESLFLLKLVLGIPAQASGKNLTRPLMPSAPQTSCVRATSPLPS